MQQTIENLAVYGDNVARTRARAGFHNELGISAATDWVTIQQALGVVNLAQRPSNRAILALVEPRLPFYRQVELMGGIAIDPAARGLVTPLEDEHQPPYAVWLEITGHRLPVIDDDGIPSLEYRSLESMVSEVPNNKRLATPFEGLAVAEEILADSIVALAGGEFVRLPSLAPGMSRNRVLCLEHWLGRPRISHTQLSEPDPSINLLVAYR